MLIVNSVIQIPLTEFVWAFVRAGGPGGQNVNKVASKAVLRWAVDASPSVPPAVKARLCSLHRRRVTQEGEFLITSQRFRDQEKNRTDCLEKLAEMIREAAIVPKARKETKPSFGSKLRRLDAKRRQSDRKSARKAPRID